MKLSQLFAASGLVVTALSASSGAQAQDYQGGRWAYGDQRGPGWNGDPRYDEREWHGDRAEWDRPHYRPEYRPIPPAYYAAAPRAYRSPSYRIYHRVAVRPVYHRPAGRCWYEYRPRYRVRVCR